MPVHDNLNEVCDNCGLNFGAHHGGSYPVPYDTCPGNQNAMNWNAGGGTLFKPTGVYKYIPKGTPAKNRKGDLYG